MSSNSELVKRAHEAFEQYSISEIADFVQFVFPKMKYVMEKVTLIDFDTIEYMLDVNLDDPNIFDNYGQKLQQGIEQLVGLAKVAKELDQFLQTCKDMKNLEGIFVSVDSIYDEVEKMTKFYSLTDLIEQQLETEQFELSHKMLSEIQSDQEFIRKVIKSIKKNNINSVNELLDDRGIIDNTIQPYMGSVREYFTSDSINVQEMMNAIDESTIFDPDGSQFQQLQQFFANGELIAQMQDNNGNQQANGNVETIYLIEHVMGGGQNEHVNDDSESDSEINENVD